jgi:hypothetical protein
MLNVSFRSWLLQLILSLPAQKHEYLAIFSKEHEPLFMHGLLKHGDLFSQNLPANSSLNSKII